MADEFYRHAGIAVKVFFEWKNAEGLREASPDDAYTPRTPGPELRADVVDVFYAAKFQFARKAEVETGKVGEDGEGGLTALGFGDESAHGAEKGGEVA